MAIRVFANPDYIPYAEFLNPKFENLDIDSLVSIPDPPQSWANPKDCVDFTCTGLYNVVMRFEHSQFYGDDVANMPRGFSIISYDNKEPGSTTSSVIPGCKPNDNWNAYLCSDKPKVGVLMFDSLDDDRMDRSVQPVYIQANTTDSDCKVDSPEEYCYNNKLNSYMDHCWDGFYTC